MSELTSQPWLAAQADDFLHSERAAEARDLWSEHEGDATQAALAVAVRVIEELAGATTQQPVGVAPPPPPPAVYAPLGGPQRGEAVAQATWNVVGALASEADMQVTDPFIADQLQVISHDHRGDGVYLFTWWAWSAFQFIRSTRDTNGVEVARLAITSRLAGLS